MKPVGVLVVGAGPAGLAAAIRAKRALAAAGSEAAVVVVDKAPKAGYHSLSGALLEPACLDELTPGWREEKSFFVEHLDPIERDGMFFLTPRHALPIPHPAVPRPMHHAGNVSISMAHFVEFLSRRAEKLGVEIYYGYSVSRLIVEEGKVAGVRLVEAGLNKEGEPKPNYLPPEEIRAPVTVIADGSRGVLSTEYRELFGGGPNPQVYSIGLKAVYRFPKGSPFGRGRSVHTLGFPAPRNVFGGGFIYSMGESQTAVGLILGLDWPCGDLNPYAAFEAFKSHPRIAAWLEGGVPVATGARTIPEGGYYALARLFAPGALVAGDGAGFVNMEKIKGIHYAILTGGAAGETAAAAVLDKDFSEERLAEYAKRIDALGLTAEFKRAKNYRQVFQWGLYLGAPLSMVQRLIPFRIPIRPDADSLRRKRHMQLKLADGLDQAAFVGLSGTRHREDEPSHVRILDARVCEECERNYFCACAHFCPGQVYRRSADKIVLSPSNCLHCGTCADKCPFRNILWQAPEGGEGPRFRQL
jgi:electron-transferring-flavoprotein dehydrogenase